MVILLSGLHNFFVHVSDDVALHIIRVLKKILSDYQEGPSRAQLTCKTKQNGRRGEGSTLICTGII